jgi:hypothetical protein
MTCSWWANGSWQGSQGRHPPGPCSTSSLVFLVPPGPPNPLFIGSRTLDCNQSGEVVHAVRKLLSALQGLERTRYLLVIGSSVVGCDYQAMLGGWFSPLMIRPRQLYAARFGSRSFLPISFAKAEDFNLSKSRSPDAACARRCSTRTCCGGTDRREVPRPGRAQNGDRGGIMAHAPAYSPCP